MAWTAPITAVAGTPISSTFWNMQVRDNVAYVHSGKPITVIDHGVSSYAVSTNFADVDAANLSVTLSTTTGRVLVAAIATFYGTLGTTSADLDYTIDGVRQGGAQGLAHRQLVINTRVSVEFVHIVTGLSIGSHTFRLQARTALSNVSILSSADDKVHFSVVEL